MHQGFSHFCFKEIKEIRLDVNYLLDSSNVWMKTIYWTFAISFSSLYIKNNVYWRRRLRETVPPISSLHVFSNPCNRFVDCGPLKTLDTGQTDFSNGTTYESVATFSCNEGYSLTPAGASTVTCLSNCSWSSPLASCKIKGTQNHKSNWFRVIKTYRFKKFLH